MPVGWIRKWLRYFREREGLDILLGQAPEPSAQLRQRLDWLRRLVNWVRSVGPSSAELGIPAQRIQLARLRYIVQVLERNPLLRKRVAASLRSILRDTRALELFLNVGIPGQEGFLAEFSDRLSQHWLPHAPRDEDLVSVFAETFSHPADAEWIRQMDGPLFIAWLELLHFGEAPGEEAWGTLLQDLRDSVHLLAHAIRAIGLSKLVRNRVAAPGIRDLPFFELSARAEALLAATDDAARLGACRELQRQLSRCHEALDEVETHFRGHGVSISLVYQTERLRAMLRRLGTLASLLAGYDHDLLSIQKFFALLVRENLRARRLKELFRDNLSLVCLKIIETNAETGEHYISRDRDQHWQGFARACGGGAMTAGTTLFKFVVNVNFAPFISGLIAFGNYSTSFVAMQLMGITLATKQPAMTASALAARLKPDDDSVEALVDELVHLIRSQLTAVTGNVLAVIPSITLIAWLLGFLGLRLTDAHHAEKVIQSFSILGPTPLYAAETGVLLWVSSVLAGWFHNWFCYRRLPEAIEHHPRLRYVFGEYRARRLAAFLKSQSAGVAASVSLGFLLAMVPQLGGFFGIPLDVRHVTLSSGSLTVAVLALGNSVMATPPFWLAVAGIASTAVLNLAVSFALALIVAIWAKRTSGPQRSVIYRSLFRKFVSRPWIFFFPEAKPAPQNLPL